MCHYNFLFLFLPGWLRSWTQAGPRKSAQNEDIEFKTGSLWYVDEIPAVG